MKCRWIIENFTDSEDYNDLIQAVKDWGYDCYVIGRRNNFDFNPSGFKENDCVLFQGSIQMTRHVRNKLPKGCFPIAFCTEENYLCSKYYPIFKDDLFNDKYDIVPVAELKANKFDYYSKFGKEAMIYIRPDRGDKPFAGQLLDLQDFDRFWNNNVVCNATENDLVIVSTPKNILGEWRFVVSKEGIIACSTYVYQGQKTLIPSAPAKACLLVEHLLNRNYYPDPIFAIDICQDNDGCFWLLELNSFSSAGLYACKKDLIVQKASEIAEREHSLRST
jgi:hypothetical protein